MFLYSFIFLRFYFWFDFGQCACVLLVVGAVDIIIDDDDDDDDDVATAASQNDDDITGHYCARSFDNVTCWPDTPAGHVAVVPCPTHIQGLQLSPGQPHLLHTPFPRKKCPLLKRDFLINCWDLTALSAPIGDIVPYKENLFPDKIKHRPNKLGIRKRLKSLHPAASRRTCFSQSLIRFSNWIISHFSRHRWYV